MNLSNNDLSKIEGISFCHHLVELDLSINRIVRIEGLEELSQLEILRMNGNEVSVLEKLERLGKLRILEVMRNKICNIDHIAFITSIEELQLAENKLDDLDRVGKAVLNLKRLRTLTLNGNPIEQHRDYRLRVLENENVMMLDSSEIKPQLRDHLDDMKKKQDLDEIVELTTNEYMARIEREQFRKTQSVNFFRAREKEIEDAFLEYRSQMERELEDCVSYIQGLSNRKDLLDRSYLATEDGMHEWRTMLDEAQRQRQEDTEAQEDQRKGNLRQEAVQQSAGMSFTGKLYELSFRRPDLWRRMKSMELKQTQMEEREQADEQRKLRFVEMRKSAISRGLFLFISFVFCFAFLLCLLLCGVCSSGRSERRQWTQTRSAAGTGRKKCCALSMKCNSTQISGGMKMLRKMTIQAGVPRAAAVHRREVANQEPRPTRQTLAVGGARRVEAEAVRRRVWSLWAPRGRPLQARARVAPAVAVTGAAKMILRVEAAVEAGQTAEAAVTRNLRRAANRRRHRGKWPQLGQGRQVAAKKLLDLRWEKRRRVAGGAEKRKLDVPDVSSQARGEATRWTSYPAYPGTCRKVVLSPPWNKTGYLVPTPFCLPEGTSGVWAAFCMHAKNPAHLHVHPANNTKVVYGW